MRLTEHLEKLVLFESVCRLKSFTLAAHERSRSQPAVSRAIKELETAVGVQLLTRSNRGIKVSAVGRQLLQASQKIIQAADQFETSLANGKELAERVTVGTKEPVAVHVWAEFSAWCKRMPSQREVFEDLKRVELKIEKSNTRLVTAFNARELDLLVMPPDERIARSATTVKLFDTVWDWYSAEDFAESIDSAPLIIYEQTLVGEKLLLKDVLRTNSPSAPILRVNSLGAAMALCSRGFGLTILPTWMAARSVASGELRPLQDRRQARLRVPERSKVIAAFWKPSSQKTAVMRIAKAVQVFCRERSNGVRPFVDGD